MGSISTRIDTDYSYLAKPKQIKEYSIVFKNGEEILKIVKGPYGTPVSCPDVEKEGYGFNGWSVNGKTAILPVDAITDCDITYVALWYAKQDVVEEPVVFGGPLQADGMPAEPLRAKQPVEVEEGPADFSAPQAEPVKEELTEPVAEEAKVDEAKVADETNEKPIKEKSESVQVQEDNTENVTKKKSNHKKKN